MADISFSSVGSGIDFGVIRDAIIAQRSRPISLMQNKANDYTTRIDSLKQLNTALASLTSAAEALKSRDLGSGRSTTTGDALVATATATASANLGSYDLNVTRLATSLTQSSRAYASTAAPVLAGGAATATFELRKGGAAEGVAVTIDATNNTLAGLRDAINAKNAGVTATIIDASGSGTAQQLVLTSKETGASGRVELVETTATGTGADIGLGAINPPDGDFAKLNAALTINGLPVTRATNTFSDAIAGVTFNLKKAGATTVGVTQSTDIENKLRGFVNAYNAIQDIAINQYKKDAKNRPTGVLAGDPTLRTVQQQLREALGAPSEDNGGLFTSLSEIGITRGDDGRLTLDSAAFNEKLRANPDDVRALIFGRTESDTGLFERFHEASSGLSDSVTGSVKTAISGYESSLKSLNDTITKRTEALGRLRTSLIKQFSVADAAIGQLNSQGSALDNVVKSLQKASQ